MAQKRINDLQLRSDFDATCNFPSDDLVQTWRVTGAQVLAYIQANLDKNDVRKVPVSSKTSAYTALVTDDVLLVDATSGAFTVTLPTVATSTGKILKLKKIDSSVNAITIDGNGAETIDGAATIALVEQYESLSLVCNGTAWFIL